MKKFISGHIQSENCSANKKLFFESFVAVSSAPVDAAVVVVVVVMTTVRCRDWLNCLAVLCVLSSQSHAA